MTEDHEENTDLSADEQTEAPAPQVRKPRVKRLRLILIALPLIALAIVSTVFGMMMAVASELPNLQSSNGFKTARNSVLLDALGRPLGILKSTRNRVLIPYSEISPFMRNAVISVEDQRFYENNGVDPRGILRAFVQATIAGGARQGGSTITQQFVKNALNAQDQRTVPQKLRESALAYHLTRKWSKEKILSEYLNSIYFGNGAYGIESAARVYFGRDANHLGCGVKERPCAAELNAAEAALLTAVIANPTAYDPVARPQAALTRRNTVLGKMRDQERISIAEYDQARAEGLPALIVSPSVDTKAPYFTTWVSQQLVDHFGARRAFEGGLRVRTTLDLDFQEAAQQAVDQNLSDPNGPSGAVVVIDNKTGEVKAMIGGRDYQERPFNLATQGQRQPGSTVKPFILAAALRKGYGLGSVWESRKRVFDVPGDDGEKFTVNNFDKSYSGTRDLGSALTVSDNAVFAAVGLETGTRRISKLITNMGVRSPVSTNPAMTLGAFKQGVSVLDWAHAFQSFAAGGKRTSGTLGAPDRGPVGIHDVRDVASDELIARNKTRGKQVITPQLAQLVTQQMQTVVSAGTGRLAQYGGFAAGKTGTTENFGDAWFAGFTDRYTIAVWVGYADRTQPMETEYDGSPVAGGTIPAQIWRDFVIQIQSLLENRSNAKDADGNGDS
ncbi:MAG: transglycosylase domain-containing protein, partial [Solirubrobacteraceae bacterium]|nr:transglycosylase domain-containing protein [Solirubrobacteraceae bacterium]